MTYQKMKESSLSPEDMLQVYYRALQNGKQIFLINSLLPSKINAIVAS